jgi:hypothetical protein
MIRDIAKAVDISLLQVIFILKHILKARNIKMSAMDTAYIDSLIDDQSGHENKPLSNWSKCSPDSIKNNLQTLLLVRKLGFNISNQ